jgi:hypothetical protein
LLFDYDLYTDAEKIFLEEIDNEIHHYIIMVKNLKIDINRLKFDLINFNLDNYDEADFIVSAVDFNDEMKMITVKSQNTKEESMSYFNDVKSQENIFKNIADTDIEQFIITADNFTLFFKEKDFDKYFKFFKKYYLKEGSKNM